jgi:phytoene dehydrogenase-like protein
MEEIETLYRKDEGGLMRKWDVVILGANASGIIAGALLTKKGFSVLLLEEKLKAGYVRGKYRFQRFSNLSELLVSRATVEGVYQLLGLPFAHGEFTHRRNLKYQILLPGHRVDIPVGRAALLDEITREFPRDCDLIETFYTRVQERDWIRRSMMAIGDEQPLLGRIERWLVHGYHALSDRPLSAFLASLKGDKAFARFIDVQIKSMSYLLADDLPFGLASYLIGIFVQDEVFTDIMGSHGFKDMLKGEVVGGGGRINTLESFDTIRIEKDEEEFRIYTKGEGKPIASRVFIGNIPFIHLKRLIPAAFSGRKWAEKGKRLCPKFFILSLNLGIDARGIPIGLGDCFVSLRDLDAPYENGNLLMVFVGPEGIGAPSGKRSVTVNAFVPLDTGESARAGIKRVIESMLIHLLDIAPFFDRSIRIIDGRPSIERYRGQWTNSDIIYGGPPSYRVGDEILPTVTPLEGLFLAGRENFPYLGFEGEILSGIKAAKAISNRFG